MNTVARLRSDGVLFANLFDEFSSPSRNVSVDQYGVFYSNTMKEGEFSELSSGTPMRIVNNKDLRVFDYFDELTGVSDVTPPLPSGGGIFDNLLTLSTSLNALTSISSSNLGTVQSTIQAADPSFNVFAIPTHSANSESLSGTAAAGGKTTLSAGRFVYNSSASNILSTGKTIVDMTGGANNSLSAIDGKKWMAAAIYDGTTNGFRGILLWIFTNDLINDSNVVTSNGHPVTNTRDIFFPDNSDTVYNRIYQVVIGNSGNIITSDVTGNAGWNFSDAQNPGAATGYNATTRFSSDDGFWAFVVGSKVNGDATAAGQTYQRTGGYGFGNVNSTDISSQLYWGSAVTGTSYVGFIFTGDA
jgi:hypothetical protein